MQFLSPQEALRLIETSDPVADGNFTAPPIFSIERADVCVVKHTVDNGGSCRYDILYFVWKDVKGELHRMEIASTRKEKGFLHLLSVRLSEGDFVDVQFGTSYTFEGMQTVVLKRVSLKGEQPEIIPVE